MGVSILSMIITKNGHEPLHEEITRCHRCQSMEELVDLVLAWLQKRTSFVVEDKVYALPQAA